MEVSLSPSELIPGDGSLALFSPEAARYGDQLVLDEMPSAKVVWDDIMSGDCGLWHGLLEELEQCDHYSVDERTKAIIKHDVDVKPLHVASDEISRKVQWDDEQLPDQVADTSLLQQIAMGKGYPEGVIFSHADGYDADQMFDKASKHGIIEQTHFSAVQLELVNDSVHENATVFAKTQAVSVSDQRSMSMVPLVFESATDMVFNKLPSMILGGYEEILSDCNTHGLGNANQQLAAPNAVQQCEEIFSGTTNIRKCLLAAQKTNIGVSLLFLEQKLVRAEQVLERMLVKIKLIPVHRFNAYEHGSVKLLAVGIVSFSSE
jgi:hypothetical protein